MYEFNNITNLSVLDQLTLTADKESTKTRPFVLIKLGEFSPSKTNCENSLRAYTPIIDDNSATVANEESIKSLLQLLIIIQYRSKKFSSSKTNCGDSLMQIGLDYYDYYDDCEACNNCDDCEDHDKYENCDKRKELVPLPRSHNTENECYLTFKEFNYTMNIFDKKITSLYKLCRHISDQQQKDT